MAIKKIDLKKATAAELEAHQKDVAAMIEAKRREEASAKFEEVIAFAASRGLSRKALADYFSGGRKTGASKKPRKPVAPKYRNPKDKSQTWSGRGRKPRWVEDYLTAGGKLSDKKIAA